MPGQRDHDSRIQGFLDWVNQNCSNGTLDIKLGPEHPFMPARVVEDYFKDLRRVIALLDALFSRQVESPHHLVHIIQRKFCRVFAISLSSNMGEFIETFIHHDIHDQKLPFTDRPSHFPTATDGSDLWESFYDAQWRFCSPRFERNMNPQYPTNRILPIVERELLDEEGNCSKVYKIRLHGTHNDLGPSGRTDTAPNDDHANTFVLKTYTGPDAEEYYKTEAKAFRNIMRGGPIPEELIGFYCSFEKDGTYNLLLEYADRGTLRKYLEETPAPSSARDILKLYSRLFNIIAALCRIHEVGGSNEDTNTLASSKDLQIFRGSHQDIKPENILVMTTDTDGPFYNVTFKLADLGTSHFETWQARETPDWSKYGTRIYGAPECYRFRNENHVVKQSVDIWSLGCVFTEFAVWASYGKDGLKRFQDERREATANLYQFQGGNCFHDGQKLLPIVAKWHSKLVEEKRSTDHVIEGLVDLLENMLAEDEDSRPTAKNVRYRLHKIVGSAEKELIRNQASKYELPTTPPPNPPPPDLQIGGIVSNGGLPITPRSGVSNARQPSPRGLGSPSPLPVARGPSLTQRNGNARRTNGNVRGESMSNTGAGGYQHLVTDSSNHDYLDQPTLDRLSTVSPSMYSENPIDIQSNSASPPNVREISGPKLPEWSVREGITWREKYRKSTRRYSLSRRGKNQEALSKIPASEEWLPQLNNRDHVFLIDDSTTMRPHWGNVEELLDLLAYMVKSDDPDGVELYFMNSNDTKQSRKATALVETVQNLKPNGFSDAGKSIGVLLNDYVKKLVSANSNKSRLSGKQHTVRPKTVYVFTDGKWQPNSDLEGRIGAFAARLHELDTVREQFGIQFIRFGNDPEAEDRLNMLDTLNRRMPVPRDIVDWEDSRGNVWKMLFGSFNKWFDSDAGVPQSQLQSPVSVCF